MEHLIRHNAGAQQCSFTLVTAQQPVDMVNAFDASDFIPA